jgi:hypothetical protein
LEILREDYEDCAEAFQTFASLSMGALLGKYNTGEIDDAGFLLGDAHLGGFMAMNTEKICSRFGVSS